ncbi:MAG: MFS transporter [Methanospirillaceae archaeon]|nr:MFS transporter [Methanospirillaceae archaeon]
MARDADIMRHSYLVIVLLGIVALCGDIIYEGARSISGPYLLSLGGSAVLVGTITGGGEFLGYAVRLISGRLADLTHHYWSLTIGGYAMLIAIPLLAFSGSWEMAALLFILERIGKGIRSPAKDAILANATAPVGRGLGFGIHELLDQIGAVLGPVVLAVSLAGSGEYTPGFLFLFIPFIFLMVFVVAAWRLLPDPAGFERKQGDTKDEGSGLDHDFFRFSLFTLFCTTGFLSFPLISFHAISSEILLLFEVPILYALAMLVDAVIAPVAGRFYDKRGIIVLFAIPLTGVCIPFLGFGMSREVIYAAAILFGVSMGILETVLRAVVADIIPIKKRGTAFGIFNTVYGAGFFMGGVIIGFCYEYSLILASFVPAVISCLACGYFFRITRHM